MRKPLILITLLTALFNSCNAQSDTIFKITETVIEQGFEEIKKDYLEKKDSVFFEDENYKVRRTCSGEWGGSIWFKNKKTGIEYSCAATCPVVVTKLNNKYFVTNTLAHLSGFSEVIEIENPDSMKEFKLPKPRKKNGKTIIRYVGDDETKSTKGTKQLVDSIGVLTLASFPYNKSLFHIITDFEKTFVAKVENNEFVIIDTVSNESIWTYNPEVIRTEDNHYVVFFSNSEIKGYLDIFKNKIVLRKYK